MFKVLIIAYNFPPMGISGVQRTLKFAKYMTKYNWKPTILTSNGYSNYAYDLSLLKEAEDNKIEVIRTSPFDPAFLIKKRSKSILYKEKIKSKLNNFAKYINIPDNKIRWTNLAYKAASEILKKETFDVIMVSCPPFSSFILAAKLKKEFDLPLFVDYRDLWINRTAKRSISPFHKLKNKKLEYDALKASDKVVVVNRKIKEKMLLTYPFLRFEDIMIIPNGFDPEDIKFVKTRIREDKKFRITYSGIFNEYASPIYFLSAFKKIVDERPEIAKNIELHFVGSLKKDNLKLIEKLNISKYIFYHGSKDYKESLRFIFESDILWMMVENQKNAYTISGGRLYEYFGSQKPIIACVPEGAASQAAIEYGASFICEPNNIEVIKNTIIHTYNLFQENKLPAPNQEFVNKLNREHLTEQLTKEFQFFIKEL